MKILLLLLLALSVLSCASQKQEVKTLPFTNSVLFVGFEPKISSEGIACGGQGWADFNCALWFDKTNANFISVPRDALVMVPKRGYWLVNSLYYNLGPTNLRKYFATNYNLKTDKTFAISVDQVRQIVGELSVFPQLAEIITNYKYMEDWTRSRHKLGIEIRRQRRIQVTMERVINIGSTLRLPGVVENKICEIILRNATYSDLTVDDLKNIRMSFREVNRRYGIYPGEYRVVKFNYSWYNHFHDVYVTQVTNNFEISFKEENPFVYSETNFFLKKSVEEVTHTSKKTNIYGIYNQFK